MRRVVTWLVLLGLLAIGAGACRAPRYVLEVHADPSVTWEGWYTMAWDSALRGGRTTAPISGAGDWVMEAYKEEGAIRGLAITVNKTCEQGTLRAAIKLDGRVLAEDSASGPLEGVSCIWGNP